MSRDYTKEVGLTSTQPIVPWRYALPILALVAAVALYGLNAGIAAEQAKKHAPKEVTSVQVFIR